MSRSAALQLMSPARFACLSATVDVTCSIPSALKHVDVSLLVRYQPQRAAAVGSHKPVAVSPLRCIALAQLSLPRWPVGDDLHVRRTCRPLPDPVELDVVVALEPLTSSHRVDLLVPPSPEVSSPLPLVASLLETQLGFGLVQWEQYAAVAGVKEEAASPADVSRLLVSTASSSVSSVCCVVRLSPAGPCQVRVFASRISACVAFLVRLQEVLASTGMRLIEEVASAANLAAADGLLSSLTREAELAVSTAVRALSTATSSPLTFLTLCLPCWLVHSCRGREQLDGIIRQCDVADMAQASRQLQHRQPQQLRQPGATTSALDSRAEEIALQHFRHVPTWLEQSAAAHSPQRLQCAPKPPSPAADVVSGAGV